MSTILEREMLKGFRRMHKAGGTELVFAGEQVPVVLETIPEENLPASASTEGTGTWVRVLCAREDLPTPAPTRGNVLSGDGRSYRVAGLESEPTDPIGSYRCSVSENG